MKKCSKEDCLERGKKQPLSNFYKHAGSKDGLHPWCKKCISKKRKISNDSNDWMKVIIG